MPDSSVVISQLIPVYMPSMYCALGQVQVAGMWKESRPAPKPWKARRAPVSHGWKTTKLPDGHSGRI